MSHGNEIDRPSNTPATCSTSPDRSSEERITSSLRMAGQTASGRATEQRTAEQKNGMGVRRLLVPVVVAFVVIGAYISLKFWYNDTFYVSTENARIAGALVQVGALNAGRIESIFADVGSQVERGQTVAVLSLPSVIGVAQGASKLDFLSTDELRVEVRSPIAGTVVAKQGNVGDTVAAGQPILTVVDPNALWVSANIEETKISKLKAGQPAEVHVDALAKSFSGSVQTITPATAATFSLLPQQNGSGNFTKVTQLVPVKISIDAGGEALPLGGSVEVRIKVADPPGWLLWLR